MLFDAAALDGIAAGRITLAFRRWRAPRMQVGSRQRTPIGVVEVMSLDVVEAAELTAADAVRAGYRDVGELLARMRAPSEGDLYRMALRVTGPDPRIALRASEQVSAAEVRALLRRFNRMDAAAEMPWTGDVLTLIASAPGVRAGDLAVELGQSRDLFKRRVRRLKELGLTESLAVGYRLSPRGRALLDALWDRTP